MHGLILEGNRAVGARVESGGELFEVRGNEVILCARRDRLSPHFSFCPAVGPALNLESVGVPVVHDLPGVGRNLRDHPQVSGAAGRRGTDYELDLIAPHIQHVLRYTAEGSDLRNDMLIHAACRRPPGSSTTSPTELEPLRHRHDLRTVPRRRSEGHLEITCRLRPAHRIQCSTTTSWRRSSTVSRMREAVRICLDLAQHEDISGIYH